ncbi:four helix bundle protein [Prosthecochloris sp. SCSIO W1101]|uniref:four helix bundle protein n=1 Tax=Prosthecochloris sp. SCSIO W1101 TaxID=2992242 RepID=UPI00223D0EE0|nr:four helix bundle protein [Prosthecochloris sp. SCSIO W1101]UZJ41936.1 four helix bundle protein [Prosthecochloris sp. SCSIO W1101]
MLPHKKLKVWQESMHLVKTVYQLTQRFPQEELYGLTHQMRRAAVSIPSNLAEGAARESKKEYAYFISIARGSLSELDTQVKIAQMLGYVEDITDLDEQINQVGRLLTGIYKKWNSY